MSPAGSQIDRVARGRRALGSTLLAALLLAAAGSGCAHAPPPPPAPSLRHTVAVRTFRQNAWSGVQSLVRLYDSAPPAELPGIAGLAADLRAAARQVGARSAQPALDRLDADQLVWRNPHFWRAALELAPNDPTFPLLQALLLASAGDLWQGCDILEATLQAMPMHADVRRVYLFHREQFQQALVDSLPREYWTVRHQPPLEQLSVYSRVLQTQPDHAEVLLAFLEANRHAGAGGTELLSPAPYVETLARVDPLRAAPWRDTPAERQAGKTLTAAWRAFGRSLHTPDAREVTKLLAALEAAGVERLALSLARLAPAIRGFPAPADNAVWQRQLPKLLGPAATALLAEWHAGNIRMVSIGKLPEATDPATARLPALPPVVTHWLERELAGTTFLIESGLDNPQRLARAYDERGVLRLYAGDYAAAESDLSRARVLADPNRDPLIHLAQLRRRQGRFAEAAALFAEAGQLRTPPRILVRETAMLRFAEGDWAAATAAFQHAYEQTPGEPYFLIHGTLARLRAGQERDLPGLRKASANQRPGAWPGQLLAHLAGELSEPELLRSAQEGNEQQVLEQACEAYFVLAETTLAAGDETRGVQLLRDCVATGMIHFFEYELARAELRRLRGEEPPPPAPPPPAKREPGQGSPPTDDLIDYLVPA